MLFSFWESGDEKGGADLEEMISMLFDFQQYEKNADLQEVIDAVHIRYTVRHLTDEEAEFVAAAGTPDTGFKRKCPKDEWT